MNCNLFKYKWLTATSLSVAFACLLVGPRVTAGENYHLALANGLDASLYTPESIMEMTVRDPQGQLILKLSSGISYRLIEDINDPQITNRGDGSFHPADVDQVARALSEVSVRGANLAMPVNIYVLPLPRSGLLTSSASGGDIFLSPGVFEIAASSLALTVTHELGHVFQHRFAPEGEEGNWRTYLELRGIADEALYASTSIHMNRPVEIFAEDFRFLFGGEESRASGRIENPYLPTPDLVSGLEEFFVALVAPEGIVSAAPASASPFTFSNYPNPFNPSTTVRVAFTGPAAAGGREASISIYRVDGTFVREIYRGSVSENEFSARWDGKDERGNEAASGVYLYAVHAEGRMATGKMLLIR